MQISLKWVNELVNIETVNLDYLIEKLTLGSFEVEEILEIEVNGKKEIILDISATANRSDSLSIQGISKEIAALLNKQNRSSKYSIKNLEWEPKIENLGLTNLNQNICSTFIGVTVENLNKIIVPEWLKQKLTSSGLKCTNNLLDFQNYLLLETGYPFEFYDLNKISTKLNSSKFSLTIEKSKDQDIFCANNGISYQLNDSLSVIKANGLPISIAGIIPNENFSYSKNTNSFLIEGSIFDPTYIRRTSRNLGLRTDRSARYEKSLKNTNLFESLYKLISLLRIANPQLICKLHTIVQILKKDSKPISLYYKSLKEILGPIKNYKTKDFTYIKPQIVTNYLNRLNFKYQYNNSNLSWEVHIPYSRSEDIVREIDLVEEIGRLHGFNNFLTRLPKIERIGNEDKSYQTRKKIISCLLNLGLNELIHYSLVNETTISNNNIKLINPLTEDYSNLRSTLLPNLIKTVQENLKQGNTPIEGFEFGHVFIGNDLTDVKEKEHVAGVFGGRKTKVKWVDDSTPLDWFEAKGKLNQFFNQLNLTPVWENYSRSTKNLIFHPYRTAELYQPANNSLGTFGQINPILAKKLNLSSNLYLFELDFEVLQTLIQTNNLPIYQEYVLYPKVIKDLSFIINEDIEFKEIQKLLYLNGSQFLVDINLLDEYKGAFIPDKNVSLCIQLTFQSNEKTLENKEIENIVRNLESLLINTFSVQIRV